MEVIALPDLLSIALRKGFECLLPLLDEWSMEKNLSRGITSCTSSYQLLHWTNLRSVSVCPSLSHTRICFAIMRFLIFLVMVVLAAARRSGPKTAVRVLKDGGKPDLKRCLWLYDFRVTNHSNTIRWLFRWRGWLRGQGWKIGSQESQWWRTRQRKIR